MGESIDLEKILEEHKKWLDSEGHKLMSATLATGNPETITALVNYNNKKTIRHFLIKKQSKKRLVVSGRRID